MQIVLVNQKLIKALNFMQTIHTVYSLYIRIDIFGIVIFTKNRYMTSTQFLRIESNFRLF